MSLIIINKIDNFEVDVVKSSDWFWKRLDSGYYIVNLLDGLNYSYIQMYGVLEFAIFFSDFKISFKLGEQYFIIILVESINFDINSNVPVSQDVELKNDLRYARYIKGLEGENTEVVEETVENKEAVNDKEVEVVDDKEVEVVDDKEVEAVDDKEVEVVGDKEVEVVDDKEVEVVDDKEVEVVDDKKDKEVVKKKQHARSFRSIFVVPQRSKKKITKLSDITSPEVEEVFNSTGKLDLFFVLEHNMGWFKFGDPIIKYKISCKVIHGYLYKDNFVFTEVAIHKNVGIAKFRGRVYIMHVHAHGSYNDVCRQVIMKMWSDFVS